MFCHVPICLFALTKELDLQVPDLHEVIYWIFLLKFAGTLLLRLKSGIYIYIYTYDQPRGLVVRVSDY